MSTKQLSKWGEMYRNRIGDTYPAYCRQQYQPFLSAIRHAMRQVQMGIVREEGCGIATITKILAQDADLSMFDFHAYDKNLDQVVNAEANCRGLVADVHTYYNDIFETSFPVEVIHSHGVLEHFSDVQIHNILERQRREAKVVIHYVPLDGWEVQSYGDERLLPIEHWVEIHKPNQWKVFNGGKDAVLIWSRR